MDRARSVVKVVQGIRTLEGGGFVVRRPFPTQALMDVDPFLLIDEMGPMEVAPGEAKGAPDHPHRGFETVTYMLAGESEHKDSRGHAGKLGPGDVQWMTAGDGVVHAEMPSDRLQREGGRMHGFQIWVNLPKRDKRMKPRYQEIPAAKIPAAKSADGKVAVRVIAGESLGAKAVIDTRTPIFYHHYTVAPGGRHAQPVPRDYSAMAWVFEGEGRFGTEAKKAASGQLVMFAPDGDEVVFAVPDSSAAPMQLLLLGGVPLREPVARYGPFVMNTEAELVEAFEDYRAGRMGRIDF